MKSFAGTFFLLFLLLSGLQAQVDTSSLFIDTSYSNIDMVEDFFDGLCVVISNPSFTGTASNAGFFDAGNTDLGINFGVAISTGNVAHLSGPPSSFSSTNIGLAGDPDLSNLDPAGVSSNDAVVLEFDFLALASDTIFFEYVFGSEEYPEYVNSSFNDVFAFFVTDANGNQLINRATLPNTDIPVTINTVNQFENSEYYIPYDTVGAGQLSLDGLTTALPAIFVVEQGMNYHVKIGVADLGDAIFDSAVFIGVGSLCGVDIVEPVAEMELVMDDSSRTVTVQNTSSYGSSYTYDFGDGTIINSTERIVSHTYTEDGEYTVSFMVENSCCSTQVTEAVTFGDFVSSNGGLLIENLDFSIQPNPAIDHFVLTFKGQDTATMVVSDLQGRKISERAVRSGDVVDVKGLEKGVYIAQLYLEQGVQSQRFLIK